MSIHYILAYWFTVMWSSVSTFCVFTIHFSFNWHGCRARVGVPEGAAGNVAGNVSTHTAQRNAAGNAAAGRPSAFHPAHARAAPPPQQQQWRPQPQLSARAATHVRGRSRRHVTSDIRSPRRAAAGGAAASEGAWPFGLRPAAGPRRGVRARRGAIATPLHHAGGRRGDAAKLPNRARGR